MDKDNVINFGEKLGHKKWDEFMTKLSETVSDVVKEFMEIESVRACALVVVVEDGTMAYNAEGRSVSDAVYLVGSLEGLKTSIVNGVVE